MAGGDDQAPKRRSTDIPDDAPWWAKWMVSNVDQAWRWASVQIPATCIAVAEGYNLLDDATKKKVIDALNTVIPEKYKVHVLAILFLAFIVIRTVKLPKKDQAPK